MKNRIFLAFDIDGTIYDAGDIIEESFRRAIESYACDTPDVPAREEIKATLGYPLDEIFVMLFPSMKDQQRNDLAVLWTANLVEMIRDKKGSLIDGARETIKELYSMEYNILVASNGARSYVEAILETYDLKKFFSEPFIYAEGMIKNKTDIIGTYLGLIPGSEMIMVGDRYTDLAAAKENGIPFIGCAFGHAGTEEIEGERYIVNQFRDIPGMIKIIEDNNMMI